MFLGMSDAAVIDVEPWIPEDTFGARLALIRQRFHWNVTEAARACEVPAATWTKWEEGSMPRDYIGTCEKIAESVGCSTNWLVGGSRNWKKLMASDLQVLPGGHRQTTRAGADTRGEQLAFRHLSIVPT